jgi:leucyl-tRNA synthetase
MVYDFKRIEKKWQDRWEKEKVFEVSEKKDKEKFYVLDMFPYPSGAGLHMGHAFTFSLGDIFARFKRLQGFNVLYPVGYDALGLPAENAAIKAGIHPSEYTAASIKNFSKQQKSMGWSYDWSRLVNTSNPDYYRWDQWIFLKMLEKGIAYRKRSPVNWCPKCETVLANEQVTNGCCWRHEDTKVEIKPLEQWFFKITDYVEDLLEGLEKLDWSERAKKLQRNWIGKSYGTEIEFEINGKKWPIFTTRPDTLFGVTFMVVSAQHLNLMELVSEEQKEEVETFLKKLGSVSEKELADMEKEGVFTGSYAVNPVTQERIPVYVGNFVVADYGSGMVMAVPAHDQRDFEFAKKYDIKIKQVIEGEVTDSRAYTNEGNLINSGEFNGLNSKEARDKITSYLEEKGIGKKTIQYKLRDWLISRQRYWGTPIPVVYCDKCGIVPLKEEELPLKLPEKVEFGKGNPLLTNENWLKTKCPKCGENARRETDTMDTFVNSSWYFLRYCDSKNEKKIFDSEKANYWAPIDQYVGGPEHITMHLIYIRFYTKFLKDLGLINFDEPALKYFTQGIVHASDGEKMSKSKGNVVEPLEMIEKFGADTLRLALVSFASPDKDTNWDEKTLLGSSKFLDRVYEFFYNFQASDLDKFLESKFNNYLKNIVEEISNFKHNLVVIKIRELFSLIEERGANLELVKKFLILLHIYCPHITEELWEKIGGKGFISEAEWPKLEERKIDLKLEEQEEQKGKIVGDIRNIMNILESKGELKEKSSVTIYAIPSEVGEYDPEDISKKIGMKVSVRDIKEAKSSGKVVKAKPGKPGILID